jgi:hypothetical protein
MSPKGFSAKYYCAGEVQKQFTQPDPPTDLKLCSLSNIPLPEEQTSIAWEPWKQEKKIVFLAPFLKCSVSPYTLPPFLYSPSLFRLECLKGPISIHVASSEITTAVSVLSKYGFGWRRLLSILRYYRHSLGEIEENVENLHYHNQMRFKEKLLEK